MVNWLDALFFTVGGLGLFLFGMKTMSDGLKKSSSDNIRAILASLTRNRAIALMVGTLVTMLVQSSSATTVMTVGLVNAGLLTLKQAISVILGANIGTTFTAWLVSIIGKFKISYYALPAIGVGFFMMAFSKRRRVKEVGEIVFGFGILFLGLDVMKDAFGPLKKSTLLSDTFATFSTNPLLGVAVGAIFTMVLQSSSATIAVTQLLAFNGVIGFEAAIPIILGDNIGTTITAQLGALGTNTNAKRTAMGHTLFNVFGTVAIIPFVWIGVYSRLVDAIFPGEIAKTNIMAHLAVAHSLFNVTNAILFTFLLKFLVKVSCMLVKDRGEGEVPHPMLEKHLLDNPAIAMDQSVKELLRMTRLAKKTVINARDAFFDNDVAKLALVREQEESLDEFQREITRYLIQISKRHLDTRESMEYPILLHSVNDIEKIGDYSDNIANYAESKIDRKVEIPADGARHLEDMFGLLYELFDNVIEALENQDSASATRAVTKEDQIDDMKTECRQQHIQRLKDPTANPEGEMLIMDMATNIEKMGDHLVNIAKAVLKDLQWGHKADLSNVPATQA